MRMIRMSQLVDMVHIARELRVRHIVQELLGKFRRTRSFRMEQLFRMRRSSGSSWTWLCGCFDVLSELLSFLRMRVACGQFAFAVGRLGMNQELRQRGKLLFAVYLNGHGSSRMDWHGNAWSMEQISLYLSGFLCKKVMWKKSEMVNGRRSYEVTIHCKIRDTRLGENGICSFSSIPSIPDWKEPSRVGKTRKNP